MNAYEKILKSLENSEKEYNVYSHNDISTFEMGIKNTNFDIDKIVKTLAFKVNDTIIFVSLLGIDKLDYKKLADTLNVSRSSLKMVEQDELKNLGFEIGGISPIFPDSKSIILLDENISSLDQIYCGIGLRSKTLQINPIDLQSITNAKFVEIAKVREENINIKR